MNELGREPICLYGSLQSLIEQMRAHRPQDLNSRAWRRANPSGAFAQWQRAARACLREGLHYDPPVVDLAAVTLDRVESDDFVRERIEFNTTPWFRVPGYFYTPKRASLPAPGLIVLHEWGGPMLFGAERICGEPAIHDVVVEHRNVYTSGRAIADWYASNGYAVICIDAYHFGRRAIRCVRVLPDTIDPRSLDRDQLHAYHRTLQDLLYLGVRQLNWAGTTWAGVNFVDDSRCVDYLRSRPEVDPSRIGATGLSGGGWRTNMLAALDERVRCAVPVGWMTTGDTQQRYNVEGAVGTFCLLPGVWDRMDIPDLIAMAAPRACMVVSAAQDLLFPPAGQLDAAEQIAAAYAWAGRPDRFRHHAPNKPHCYDAEIQEQALAWLDAHLKDAGE
jgi:dienelactone hydrolase